MAPEEATIEPSKVVSLRGEEIRQPNEPCADLIAKLEDLLEMARGGEIKGMIAAVNHWDGCTSARRAGAVGRSTIGMIEILKLDLCQEAK